MKTFIPRVAAVAALTLLLAGCSGNASGETGGEALEFQTNMAASDPALATLQTVTDKFAAANPGVKIDLIPNSGKYEADMKVRMASHDMPDLLATHGWSLLRYGSFLEPLNTQSWAGDFNPALTSAMANEAGEFYALPVNTDISGIVYNKSVLEEAGIDPESLKTWTAFNAAAQKIKDKGIIPISASAKVNVFIGNIADFIASGSFGKSARDGFKNGTFDEAGYGRILDLVAGWRDAEFFNPDYSSATADDIARSMAEGKTAFSITQSSLATKAFEFQPDAKLGFMPVPGFDGQPFLVGGEGTAFGVSKTSENKEQALKYLAFLAEPANLGQLAGAVGGTPGLTNATSDLGALQESYDTFASNSSVPLQPYFDRVYLPNGMWNTMVSTADSVASGQAAVPAAVAQMKGDFTSLFGQK
ncbi:MAG: extracellular solute-binding protein [Specibacter sp.]